MKNKKQKIKITKFASYNDIPKKFNGIAEVEANTTQHRFLWMSNGKTHREDGPACIWLHGCDGPWWYLKDSDRPIQFPPEIQTGAEKVSYIKSKNFW